MDDLIQIHERLATLEAGQVYTNLSLDELKGLLKEHASSACDGNCEVGLVVKKCERDLTHYKRVTWLALVGIVAAGLKSLFPG